MRYIEVLERYEPKSGERSLFLAGSINGAPDWQAKYRAYFEDTDLVLLNPRRDLVNHREAWDEAEGRRQIEWEYEHLRIATAISFWFAAEGVGYSSALELGAAVERDQPIFVGTHPLYWKDRTIVTQARSRRPDLAATTSLLKLANLVRVHFDYAEAKSGGGDAL